MGVELLSRAPSARLLRAVLLAAAALSAQSTRCLSAAPRVVRRFETGEQVTAASHHALHTPRH